MIADLTFQSAKLARTVKPTRKAILAESVSMRDVMAAARELQQKGMAWSDALSWAHQCKREWMEAKAAAEEAKRQAFFASHKRRQKTVLVRGAVSHEGGSLAGGQVVEFYSPRLAARVRAEKARQ